MRRLNFHKSFHQVSSDKLQMPVYVKSAVEAATGGVLWEKLLQPANLLKKENLAHVFSYEFCEIFYIFFIEHLRATVSESRCKAVRMSTNTKITLCDYISTK